MVKFETIVVTLILDKLSCGVVWDLRTEGVDQPVSGFYEGQHAPTGEHEAGGAFPRQERLHNVCHHAVEELEIFVNKGSCRNNNITYFINKG